jgi:tRNA (guanine-N7-)-methyltransferase
MPRKTFAIRRVPFRPPDQETADRYLIFCHSGELYHHPERFPRVTSQALFDNDKPLELEVGCGTGEFLNHLAEAHPQTNYIGVDTSVKSLYAGIAHASSHGTQNIRFLRAGIQQVYALLDENSLQTVYLHFPDPYLHPKYRKRQIFGPTFLDAVHRALVPGGLLSVMTDNPDLFDLMLKVIERDARFEKTHEERFLTGSPWERKSRYQLAWERRGRQPIRFMVRNRK